MADSLTQAGGSGRRGGGEGVQGGTLLGSSQGKKHKNRGNRGQFVLKGKRRGKGGNWARQETEVESSDGGNIVGE